jgi:AAA+ ATPase superfamily predicted ATPase
MSDVAGEERQSTVYFNSVMPPTPRYLFARADLLDEINRKLSSKRILVLYGKPGSGKSTLARHFGESFVSSGGYVREIKCDLVRKMLDNLVDLLSVSKRYKGNNEAGKIDRESLFRETGELLREMCAEDKRVLFIFDNVDFFHRISNFFNALPAQVKVLISTRNEDLLDSFSETDAMCMRVNAFTRQEFESFLQQAFRATKSDELSAEKIESFYNIIACSANRVRSVNANRLVVLALNNIELLHVEDLIKLMRQNRSKLFSQ